MKWCLYLHYQYILHWVTMKNLLYSTLFLLIAFTANAADWQLDSVNEFQGKIKELERRDVSIDDAVFLFTVQWNGGYDYYMYRPLTSRLETYLDGVSNDTLPTVFPKHIQRHGDSIITMINEPLSSRYRFLFRQYTFPRSFEKGTNTWSPIFFDVSTGYNQQQFYFFSGYDLDSNPIRMYDGAEDEEIFYTYDERNYFLFDKLPEGIKDNEDYSRIAWLNSRVLSIVYEKDLEAFTERREFLGYNESTEKYDIPLGSWDYKLREGDTILTKLDLVLYHRDNVYSYEFADGKHNLMVQNASDMQNPVRHDLGSEVIHIGPAPTGAYALLKDGRYYHIIDDYKELVYSFDEEQKIEIVEYIDETSFMVVGNFTVNFESGNFRFHSTVYKLENPSSVIAEDERNRKMDSNVTVYDIKGIPVYYGEIAMFDREKLPTGTYFIVNGEEVTPVSIVR